MLLLIAASNALAQQPPQPWFTQPLEQLKTFLQLCDDQVKSILANEELVTESARQVLDPMTLGVRYAELESICREITPARKAKLGVLGEAIKLSPVILEAQVSNILGEPGYFPQLFTGTNGMSGLFGLLAPANGCYFAPSSLLASRGGSVSGSVPPPGSSAVAPSRSH